MPGLDAFAGPVFHSARWQHDHALAGKRVAVIGTGASAFQLVPEVAKTASRLVVFQRSAPWMVPNPRYHARVSDAKKWLLAHLPYYARWYRFLLFWPGSDGLMPSLVVDPEIFHSECQVRYVMGCLEALLRRGARTMECRQDAFDAYNQRFDARHEGLVWSHPGMTSWYKNAAGRVTTTSPWLLVEYWGWTKTPEASDYVFARP